MEHARLSKKHMAFNTPKSQTPATKVVEKKEKPVQTFKQLAVEVSVWNNKAKEEGKNDFLSFSFKRAFMDKKTKQFGETSSLRVHDIPALILALQKAYDFATTREKNVNVEEE